jgi:LPS O-antigen subunit length determinant protein (WzzB/FepE family)
VRKTRLVSTWAANRAPAQKLKDALMRLVRKPLTEDEKEEVMVGTLEKRINVVVGEETVTIEVDWWDALTAYRLAVAAYENFLEARQFKEVSAISEAIGILENRLDEERDKVNTSVDKVMQLRAKSAPKKEGAAPRVVVRRAPAPVDPEIQRLHDTLQAKQRAITDLEETHRRNIAALETKMKSLQEVYSEFHPEVVDLRETIKQQRATEPPQLTALREEYRALEQEYEQRGGPALEAQKPKTAVTALPVEALRLAQTDEVEQPETEQAKNELRFAVGRYSSLAERIDAAKLERETQQAAFRYRYSVLRPATVPPSPAKPNAALLLIAAGVAGIMLGIGAALMTDLRSRKIYQRWQVERLLGLSVLAEVKLP